MFTTALLFGAASCMAPGSVAQIVADPAAAAGQQAEIGVDRMGRPLVNIQAPSAAGVSRNVFSQFDVRGDGVILNNARDRNPLLRGREASVILNEVNSSKPSQLQGPVAVEGARAHVVIANPSGLQIDGARFVNASRVTLTTGLPVVEDGEFRRIEVRRGVIEVRGDGLDASAVPYTDILSRAARFAARIDAQSLHVVTGANDIDPADGAIKAAKGSGEAPALALDTAALGGMYADSIVLMATEAGVGVRNSGTVQANGEDGHLSLNSAGSLENAGRLEARGDVIMSATDAMRHGQEPQAEGVHGTRVALRNTGTVLADGEDGALEIEARGRLENTGRLEARGDVCVSASEVMMRGHGPQAGGRVEIHARGDMRIEGAQSAAEDAGGKVATRSALRIAGHEIRLRASGDIVLEGVNVKSTGTLLVQAGRNLDVDAAAHHAHHDEIHEEGRSGEGVGRGLPRTPRAFMFSVLSGAEAATLRAGGDLSLTGTEVRAERGMVRLQGQGDVLMRVAHGASWRDSAFPHFDSIMTGHSNVTRPLMYRVRDFRRVTVQGRDVEVEAGRDLRMYAANVAADRRLGLQADGDTLYLADAMQMRMGIDATRWISPFGIRLHDWLSYTERAEVLDGKPVRLHGGEEVLSRSGGSQVLQGTEVIQSGRAVFAAGTGENARDDARLFLRSASIRTTSKCSLGFNAILGRFKVLEESVSEKASMPNFSGSGEIQWAAPRGLEVRLPAARETLSPLEGIGERPGTAYLRALVNRDDVSWKRRALDNRGGIQSQFALPDTGALLMTAGVSLLTLYSEAGLSLAQALLPDRTGDPLWNGVGYGVPLIGSLGVSVLLQRMIGSGAEMSAVKAEGAPGASGQNEGQQVQAFDPAGA